MILDGFKLTGKVAIVTGSSSGIGQAMAVGLAQAGADIFGVAYEPEQLETKAMVEATGRKFHAMSVNLIACNNSELTRIVEECVAKFGKVDILINNAGIIRREDAINFSEQDWYDVMEININKIFFLSQAVARQYLAQGTGGKIVSTASMLSYQGGIRVPSYTASKSAVKGLTMALCNEWARHNINVNAIAPGYVETANTAQIRADQARNEAILDRIPANRWSQASDLAGACVFLCSENASYINGFTLAVDGGWLAR